MRHYSKTGTAPGTTTLTVEGNQVQLGQDPGVKVYNAYGVQTPEFMGAQSCGCGLGTVRPTDFERSHYLNYLPYYHGWIVGNEHQLGQVNTTQINYNDPKEVEAAIAELKVHRAAAATALEYENIKSMKTSRTWEIIGGLVGVATLLVSVAALRYGR